MLRAENITFSYGDGPVLDELSIAVDAGEIVVVIGPSGVGKTTLLRLLSLAESPDSGRVVVDDTDAWAVDDPARLHLRRQLAMVFQEASLFDTTIERNVAYGLKVRRPWRERLREGVVSTVRSNGTAAAVREALDVVGMADERERAARTLSGGEAKRVSFARAMAVDPGVVLLDEPTSDLDPRNTAIIEEAITEASRRDIGVVVATHDMHQARRIADRVGVLLDGRLTEVGPTERIFENPDDDRTRRFISGELVY